MLFGLRYYMCEVYLEKSVEWWFGGKLASNDAPTLIDKVMDNKFKIILLMEMARQSISGS